MTHKKLMGFLKFQFCQVKNLASAQLKREISAAPEKGFNKDLQTKLKLQSIILQNNNYSFNRFVRNLEMFLQKVADFVFTKCFYKMFLQNVFYKMFVQNVFTKGC